MYLNSVLILLAIFYRSSCNNPDLAEPPFTFKEFDYTESPKNEIAWREWEAAVSHLGPLTVPNIPCEQSPTCIGLDNMAKIKCVRKCISASCYHDIYAFDELEEGEIDIRFQSFKGCFAQRSSRRRI